ncbi:MAG TPA: PsiF family protein [Xanthobacteraceae bacterium]|nr:PsiF family protein [Xanthobacteraceae bacterium]
MISRFVTTTVAAAFLIGAAAAPTIASAQAAQKELTPQQQKMKDCSAKWKEEKAAKKVSGKKAHNAFMSTCLKG